MALAAQIIAEEARASYEASLKTLRAFIADFPQIAQRVDDHDERLNKLESRFVELRREIGNVIAETSRVAASKRPSLDHAIDAPTLLGKNVGFVTEVTKLEATGEVEETELLMTPSSSNTPSLFSKVSFCEQPNDTWSYNLQEHEAHFPVHGHWVPDQVISRRQSFEEAHEFAKQIGGRVMKLQPQGIEGIDEIECVIVEPMGKILSADEYISTGLIVCIDGSSHDAESMLHVEFGEVLKATKWLDSGISFAFPDVSCLAEAADLEIAVEAVLKQSLFQTCILVGKGWGAQLASEIAARSRLSERIDGVVLVAPESPAPSQCDQIEMPVMLIWAQDDEVSPFNEIREWYEILRARKAPTYVKDVESGGHDFGKLLKENESVSAQVSHFTISCLLLGMVVKELDQAGNSDSIKASDACSRLCDELPPFLASQIGGDPEQGLSAALVSSDPSRIRRRMQRLTSILRDWIQEGMQEMASATE